MRITTECPHCGHKQTKRTGYSMLRCEKCGKLFPIKNKAEKTRQVTL